MNTNINTLIFNDSRIYFLPLKDNILVR